MKNNLVDFHKNFADRLMKNPKELKNYKNYIFREFEKDQNKELLLEGLKTITLATNGMAKTAQAAKLKRRSLYKILNKNGNPTLNSFFEILKSLNLRLKIA
jgi:probable addiction module antidote protein